MATTRNEIQANPQQKPNSSQRKPSPPQQNPSPAQQKQNPAQQNQNAKSLFFIEFSRNRAESRRPRRGEARRRPAAAPASIRATARLAKGLSPGPAPVGEPHPDPMSALSFPPSGGAGFERAQHSGDFGKRKENTDFLLGRRGGLRRGPSLLLPGPVPGVGRGAEDEGRGRRGWAAVRAGRSPRSRRLQFRRIGLC